MVQKAVQQRGGNDGITTEDLFAHSPKPRLLVMISAQRS